MRRGMLLGSLLLLAQLNGPRAVGQEAVQNHHSPHPHTTDDYGGATFGGEDDGAAITDTKSASGMGESWGEGQHGAGTWGGGVGETRVTRLHDVSKSVITASKKARARVWWFLGAARVGCLLRIRLRCDTTMGANDRVGNADES